MAKKTKNKALWHPALWPTWILYGFVFLLAQLPLQNKIKVGEALQAGLQTSEIPHQSDPKKHPGLFSGDDPG